MLQGGKGKKNLSGINAHHGVSLIVDYSLCIVDLFLRDGQYYWVQYSVGFNGSFWPSFLQKGRRG